MNTMQTAQNETSQIDIAELKEETVQEQMEQLEALSNEKLEEYYAQREKLQANISKLTAIGNQTDIDAAKVQLGNVEKEIAKRSEHMGRIMSSIGREMAMFKELGVKVTEDAPEDVERRQAALDAKSDAEAALIQAKADIQAAETAEVNAEATKSGAKAAKEAAAASWNFFTKDSKIRAANLAIETAKADIVAARAVIDAGPAVIESLKSTLEAARTNIASVEEQIEVDKDYRLSQLNVDVLYAKLTKAEEQVSKIVKKNITALDANIESTGKQLVFNRELAVSSAERLEVVEGEIADLDVRFKQMDEKLHKPGTDETTVEYQRTLNAASDLASQLDKLSSEKRLVEQKISTAQVNVTELEASRRALNSDLLLAKQNYNDFVLTAEKARIAGANIALLLQNQAARVSASSLGKGRDAMTLASLDTSIATDVAIRGSLADQAERRVSLLDEMAQRTASGDAAAASHDERYAGAAEDYKDKYADLSRKGDTSGSGKPVKESESNSGKPEAKDRATPELF